jgi:hypothetical protein
MGMSFAEGGNEGAFNSTTEVTILASPGSGVRRVIRDITVANRDTVSATIIIRKYKAAAIVFEVQATLETKEYWQIEKIMVLDATDEEVKGVLSGAITTTQPSFDVAYADNSG